MREKIRATEPQSSANIFVSFYLVACISILVSILLIT